MMRLVLRQLLLDGPRSLLRCAVIGAVIAVILVFEGFEQGLYAQFRAAVLGRGGDLIVMQSGVTGMIASRSKLPQTARPTVERIPGVRAANPLTSMLVIYEKDGRKTPLFVIVYQTAGAPRSFLAGGPVRRSSGIVIDESLSKGYGLSVGDSFVISDYRFEVEGISRGTADMMTPMAFITFDGLLDFYFNADLAKDLGSFPLLGFLLVDVEPGADRTAVAAAIRRGLPDADVYTPDQVAKDDVAMGREVFGSMIRLLVGIGYVAGILVVGLIVFSSVSARTREFGVLKAIGFRTGSLFRSVILEAGILLAVAIPIAIGLALVLAQLIHWATPAYLVLPLEPGPLLRTLIAGALFALLGAVIPVRAIAGIEPAQVFRT